MTYILPSFLENFSLIFLLNLFIALLFVIFIITVIVIIRKQQLFKNLLVSVY